MSPSVGFRGWFAIFLKGLCMGAADTVPGVSGGTIAIIVGIYERLIAALTALDPRFVRHLLTLHTPDGRAALAAELLRADVPFLLVLGAGVLSAAVTIATAMNVAVTQYPVSTYAFFFGLIGASAVVLYRHVDVGTPRRVLVAVVGFVVAFLVTDPSLSITQSTTLPMLFVAGAIAISAMVLPGISGAFLLLIMGQYEFVSGIPRRVFDGLGAAVGGNVDALVASLVPFVVFVSGAIVGIFSVAYAVRAALKTHREATFAFLVSLMVGALRLPIHEVTDNATDVSTSTILAVVVPVVVGISVVLLLDRYTGDLRY